jgi:hypothetical protein
MYRLLLSTILLSGPGLLPAAFTVEGPSPSTRCSPTSSPRPTPASNRTTPKSSTDVGSVALGDLEVDVMRTLDQEQGVRE